MLTVGAVVLLSLKIVNEVYTSHVALKKLGGALVEIRALTDSIVATLNELRLKVDDHKTRIEYLEREN